MKSSDRILVVGTTPDYIDWLRRSRPGRALFVTDPEFRSVAWEEPPLPGEEILLPLSDAGAVEDAIARHLATFGFTLSGIACYDCEHLPLAAELAVAFHLPYPAKTVVENCRNKLTTKKLWKSFGVATARCLLVKTAREAELAAREIGWPCVLKPVSGSGSEMTYICRSSEELSAHFRNAMAGLAARKSLPMYRRIGHATDSLVMEQWISGTEYSCDFMLDDDTVQVLRMARKFPRDGAPFGTTAAYELIPPESGPFEVEPLRKRLACAARAVGLTRAFCMVDMIDHRGLPWFIEIAPRPGGDCLPWLLMAAGGPDVISEFLDFAGAATTPCQVRPTAHYVGLRLFASRAGVIRALCAESLETENRVRNVRFQRRPGDLVRLPPEDYDSWVLGHVVYAPSAGTPIAAQNRDLAQLVAVEWEERDE